MEKPMQNEDLSTSEVENIAPEVTDDAPNPEQDAVETNDDPESPAAADADQTVDDAPDQEPAEEPEDKKRPSRAAERIRNLVAERNDARSTADHAQAGAKQAQDKVDRLQDLLQLPSEFYDLDYEAQQQLLLKRTITEGRLEDAQYEKQEAATKAEQAAEQAVRAQLETFRAKTEDARKKLPDFDAVVSNPNLQVSDEMAELIIESNRTAEISYYLGKNPAESSRIASLPPHRQGAEIRALETKLAPPSNARKTSKAPPPAKTVGGGAGTINKDPADMTMAEYDKWYASREKKKAMTNG